ncbi:hypothetical protein [Chamaesiphon sp. VAR_48_metabat_403]|uniref:hypothetical protein n=1 Tax=Chamaesiphon sp. VAR_48_metabat_403 TaxID=2964700 RepID=UPI00286DFB1A|nr:hypothetical protein [Chamaesiphon sp. VAR_48_metabat_403]
MMNKTVKIWISVISVIFAVGILLPNISALANKDTAAPATAKPATLTLTGTIRKLAVEGTCYQLAADNGQKYELMGKFPKIDGTKVRVSGVVKTDMVTICQVGQPLQVKTVRVIK